jgi:opine dehydrogenase
MAKKLAILGGGGSGLMMAADNVLRGHVVRLWEDAEHFEENLTHVAAAGGIAVSGNAATGFARAPLLTTDPREATACADVILIAALTERHAAISETLAPLLAPGQAVCFSAGNGSSVYLKRLIEKAGKDNVVGEMSGNIYPCRIVGKAN